MQGTANFHHDITDALLPQADPVLDDAATLDTAVDMLDPQSAGVERLVAAVLNRAEALDSTVVTERQAEVWRRPALPEGRPRWGRSGRW